MPKIHSQLVEIRTKVPFGIARWTHAHYQRVVVQVAGGLGEAAPNAYYGETAVTVQHALESFSDDLPDDPFAWDALAKALRRRFPHGHRSAMAAVEAAYLDAAGQAAGVPAYKLLGLEVPERSTSYTIGIGDLEQIRRETLAAVEAGYGVLKVKLGTEDDEAIVRTVRNVAPAVSLRVDANAAWGVKEAVYKLGMLEAYGIELLEQPVVAVDREGLGRVTRTARIPVIADESFVETSDLRGLIADGVNVKLAKIGGPVVAAAAMRTARSLGYLVMLGCMVETSLGITAVAQVASLADYLDLDGALLLEHDPFSGAVWSEDKRPLLPDAPGLGVRRV